MAKTGNSKECGLIIDVIEARFLIKIMSRKTLFTPLYHLK